MMGEDLGDEFNNGAYKTVRSIKCTKSRTGQKIDEQLNGFGRKLLS